MTRLWIEFDKWAAREGVTQDHPERLRFRSAWLAAWKSGGLERASELQPVIDDLAAQRHGFTDCFDRGCNGCEDCIEPDSTEARTQPVYEDEPYAWTTFSALTGQPVFSQAPPDDPNVAGWEPLYRRRRVKQQEGRG